MVCFYKYLRRKRRFALHFCRGPQGGIYQLPFSAPTKQLVIVTILGTKRNPVSTNALALAPSVKAFLGVLNQLETEVILVAMEKRVEGILPGFDATLQYASNAGEHAFVALDYEAGDVRGLYLSLNAMANHGAFNAGSLLQGINLASCARKFAVQAAPSAYECL